VLEVVAFINAFVVDLKGATVDAGRFQEAATAWAAAPDFELAFDAEFYVQFLGAFYWLFGSHEFLVVQLNIAALVLSAHYTLKTVRLINNDLPSWIILPLMLWPSGITRSTTTLREPIMTLVIVLAAYFATRYVADGKLVWMFRTVLILLVGALFHKAFAVLFAVFVLIGIWRVRPLSSTRAATKGVVQRVTIVAVGLVIVAGLVAAGGAQRGLQPLVSAVTGDTDYAARVINYKVNRDFRTTYNAPLNTSSLPAMVASLPKNWFYYNVAPFPWQVRTGSDALATAEMLVRVYAFFAIAKLYRSGNERRRLLLRPMITLHIAIMAIFAAGTSNYGTASRHHLATVAFSLAYIAIYHHDKRSRRADVAPTRGRSDRITKSGNHLAL